MPTIKDPWLDAFKKQTDDLLVILEKHPYASWVASNSGDNNNFPPSYWVNYSKLKRDAEVTNYMTKLLELNNLEFGKNASLKKEYTEARKNVLRRDLVDEYTIITKQLNETTNDLQDRIKNPAGRSGWFSRNVSGGIDTYRVRHYAGGQFYTDDEIINRLNKVIEDNEPILDFLNDKLLPTLKKKYD
jgi:hypothetical protein